MSEEVRELFGAVVSIALDAGKDIRLEWKDYHSTSNALGGSLTESMSVDNGVVMTVYQPLENEGEG